MFKQPFIRLGRNSNASKANRILSEKKKIALFVEKQVDDICYNFPDIEFDKQKISIQFLDGNYMDSDVEARRTDTGIDVTLNWNYAATIKTPRCNKIATFCFWFMNTDKTVPSIVFDMSDGQNTSAAKYSPSSFRNSVVQLPDPYFFKYRGFEYVSDHMANQNVKWKDRDDRIVWRGGVNGIGYKSFDEEMEGHPYLYQRIAMANLLRGTDADFKFVIPHLSKSHYNLLRKRDFLGDEIGEMLWVNHKYAVDIDGFTNTWSNLIIRMKLGCCVFKVASPFGFKQWYYDKLVPFEHYIPVAADLSDWFEKVEWAKMHPNECEDIANAGQRLANSMNFRSETAFAAKRIEETWQT